VIEAGYTMDEVMTMGRTRRDYVLACHHACLDIQEEEITQKAEASRKGSQAGGIGHGRRRV
jgi:hypothetical protein